MAYHFPKIKHAAEAVIDWPARLKSVEDVKMFEDVLMSLAIQDAKKPSSN
jgi:hypothetical protein